MKVVLAANQILPIAAVANHALRELASLPMEATVLLRKPATGNPAAFETFIAELCASLGISVEWRQPDTGHNRSGTYERDVSMVRAADLCIAYFHPDSVMGGGTGHVVDRAIEEDTLCRAYVWEPQVNSLDLIGSVDKDSGA